MSLEFNADKQIIKSTSPKIIGTSEASVKVGSGTDEKEVMRFLLDSTTKAPRIGVNRTGNRVEKIVVTVPGSGYTTTPVVGISAPQTAGGTQATATAVVSLGVLVSIIIVNPGSGYTSAPTVTITGGNGAGAQATASLDIVEFELDVNGAIRTSTSIISDTARILNLDIDNFVTAKAKFRAPLLKIYSNNFGTQYSVSPQTVQKGEKYYFGDNIYEVTIAGITSGVPPTHADGDVVNGTAIFRHVGYRVDNNILPEFQTGYIYPRSVTPTQGDRSDKIATTEYVLNLATNDVGGRVYVSAQIGSDLNDGRSAVAPVRTIKKAAQIAWGTPGVKETIVISGGDYEEDNPISLPPDTSVVGDNLRLVIIRPNNARKHIFKFGDKNYVTGVTYRDKLDSSGNPFKTWNYAMVFDDRQRIYYDSNTGGDFGRNLPVGTQIFGKDRSRITFVSNIGLSALAAGETIFGLNSTLFGTVKSVTFNATTGPTAYLTGSIEAEPNVVGGGFSAGETFIYPGNFAKPWTSNTVLTLNSYVFTSGVSGKVYQVTAAGTTTTTQPSHSSGAALNGTATLTFVRSVFTFSSTDVLSIRPEGEVVSVQRDTTTAIQIIRIDCSQQNNPEVDGIVLYTNALEGDANVHDFKPGEEIYITGLPSTPATIAAINGYQRVYKVLYDADGRSRRIVISKKDATLLGQDNIVVTQVSARRYSYSATLSLLNSPFKFTETPIVATRYQDACNLIRNNTEYIKDETYLQIVDEFSPNFTISSIIPTNGTGGDTSSLIVTINTGTVKHGFYAGDSVTLFKVGLTAGAATALQATHVVYQKISDTSFTIRLLSTQASTIGLTSGTTYTTATSPAILSTAYVQRAFIIPNETKCRRDIGHFINAIIMDLEFGGNYHVIEAAKYYVTSTQIGYVANEIAETVRAFDIARQLCIFAMRRWRTRNGQISDPLYVSKYTSLSQYTDPTVTQDSSSPACANVASAINTLSYLFTAILTNDNSGGGTSTTGTQIEAGYLIQRNADFIASEALQFAQAQYPALGLTADQERKCKRDIRLTLNGLVRDLTLGGNAGIVTAAESYYSGITLTGLPANELAATRFAFTKVRDLAIQAIRNNSNGTVATRTPTGSTYNSTTGVLTVTFPNPTTPVTTSHKLAFKEGAITFSCSSSGGGNLASPQPTDRNYGKSLAISNVTSSGGNTTVTVNVGDAGSATGVAHTFVSALTDGTIIIYDPVTPTYETGITRFEDWNILLYATNPLCANVAAAITTEMTLFDNILSGSVASGVTVKTYGTLYDPTPTYPDNTIYDANGKRITPLGIFLDLPYIEASPYTQNASVISFLGGNGAEVDGDKVAQPNCPFPGLKLDGTAKFPNQGKSMVASAFTIVSFNGTGYNIINDGYVQLVSVFVLFCRDGVLAQSGGYASVTNSATNFGLYALRSTGFRKDPYAFDIGQVTAMNTSVANKTTITVSGLKRKPLEHYIVKFTNYSNNDPALEYFVDKVTNVVAGVGTFTATLTLNDNAVFKKNSTGLVVPNTSGEFSGAVIKLHRPSIVNSSSHTWEFSGAGTNYLALPENGGQKIEAYEQVPEAYGRVYTSGTDELGDFKVGTFAKIENRTGNITFTGTVSISEVEFLKLKGGDVVVTGFDASNTLGGASTTDSKLPTQKAVKDYISNNLGAYINKPYSTNAVPRALVELTDSGKISIDQIPALRPFSVFTVANQAARLALEGALAGDIAIQQDTSASFILNNDLTSLYVAFTPNATYQFTLGNIFTGVPSTGQIQAIEYRKGVVYQLNITNSGSGYTATPTVTISGGNPEAGAVSATATAGIANGQVVTLTIVTNGGILGGKGYTTAPTVTIAGPGGAGITATAVALIESRLYGNIVNNIKILDTDTIATSNATPAIVDITRVVNTSSTNAANWVSLSSNQVAADQITSGVISTSRLASNSTEANSFTFLRGDQSYAPVLQSIKASETRYFARIAQTANVGSTQLIFETNGDILKKHEVIVQSGIPESTTVESVSTAGGVTTITLNNAITAQLVTGAIIEFKRPVSPLIISTNYTIGSFIDTVSIDNGGTGYTPTVGTFTYQNIDLFGGTGTGLKANVTVTAGSVTSVIITSGGINYTTDFIVSPLPTAIGLGSGLVLSAKLASAPKNYANAAIDIKRVDNLTISSDLYGNPGVARFLKSQFNIGDAGNGSISLKTGQGSGLDADTLDGLDSNDFKNAAILTQGTLAPARLSGTYTITVEGSSSSSLLLQTTNTVAASNPAPSLFSEGASLHTRFNTIYPTTFNFSGSRHQVLTLRAGGAGTDASFGGVRQLAFSDNNRLWIRGSGAIVSDNATTGWSNWSLVWTEESDGPNTGLDADLLDSKQGVFYQNSLNVNYEYLSDNRIPPLQTAKGYRGSLKIYTDSAGFTYYRFYIPGFVLNQSPYTSTFDSGQTVNLYNVSSQAVGQIFISQPVTIAPDSSYTLLTGYTSAASTSIATAVRIGSTNFNVPFVDYTPVIDGTFETASLESSSGTALLRLGRKDGTSSSPAIYFSSSANAATNYNVAFVASGGSSADGSGSLNIIAASVDSFTINSQKIWNAGNLTPTASNVANTVVLRDGSGNFLAGTITAALTGAASANVLKTGDTMSGSLNISGAGSNLAVAGTSTLTGSVIIGAGSNLTVDNNTLYVNATSDRVGIGTTEPGTKLEVAGNIRAGSFPQSQTNTGEAWFGRAADRTLGTYTLQLGGSSASGTFFEIVDRAWSKVMYSFSGEAPANTIVAKADGGVGIGKAATTGYKLDVNGPSLFADAITLSTTTDQMLTFNATDSSWAYMGFAWNGSRRAYFGLNASGNIEMGSDSSSNIVRFVSFGSYNFDNLVTISNSTGGNNGLSLSGTAPTITFRDTDHRTGYIHVNSNLFYVLPGAVNAAPGAWSQVANSKWPLTIDLTNNNAAFGGNLDVSSGIITSAGGMQLRTWPADTSYGALRHSTGTNNADYMVLSRNEHTFISARSGYGVYVRAGGNGQTGLFVDSSGYVGIRTESTSSSYACQVGGAINIQGEIYKNGVLFSPLPAQSTATIGATLKSNGTSAFWEIDLSSQYATAFTITRGYTMAGYKDAASWKNVNSLNHSTNSQTNLGDLLSFSDGYCAGAQNLNMIAYVFTTANSWDGTSATVSKVNMNTNVNAGTTSVNSARNRTTLMRRDFQFAYVYGAGGAQPSKFNLTNDTSAFAPNGNPEGNVNNAAGGYGAIYGWTKKSNGYYFPWATETYAGWNSPPATDGTNKTISARNNRGYWNTGGGYSTGNNWSKRTMDTGTEIASISKPAATGEESLHTGMSNGYMCGMYNGAQNNQGGIMNYTADTFTFNASVNRVGPSGSASGAGTEFGTVTAGYTGI